MTLGVAYTASLGKYLPGPDNGTSALLNATPLQYVALGSLLTATANAANIAKAQAIFPEHRDALLQLRGNHRPDAPPLPAIRVH